MAKANNGLLGPFSGAVGPVIGYMWRGRMVMRGRPRQVANPRTERQMLHRGDFRRMVQLAAQMRPAVMPGMHEASLAAGMTEYNLFVKLNFGCIGGGVIDYSRLKVSTGDVAPVAVLSSAVDGTGTLRVAFGKAPSQRRPDAHDEVMLYAFCPELGEGRLALPVYRKERQIAMALPDGWAGREVAAWCFVRDGRGHCSESVCAAPAEAAAATAEASAESGNTLAATAVADEGSAGASAATGPATVRQLSLFDGFA